MKCANCSEDARYVYPRAVGFELFFCRTHLPKFLSKQAKAGLLPDASIFAKRIESAKKVAQSLKAPKVEEPVVEETVSEEE